MKYKTVEIGTLKPGDKFSFELSDIEWTVVHQCKAPNISVATNAFDCVQAFPANYGVVEKGLLNYPDFYISVNGNLARVVDSSDLVYEYLTKQGLKNNDTVELHIELNHNTGCWLAILELKHTKTEQEHCTDYFSTIFKHLLAEHFNLEPRKNYPYRVKIVSVNGELNNYEL